MGLKDLARSGAKTAFHTTIATGVVAGLIGGSAMLFRSHLEAYIGNRIQAEVAMAKDTTVEAIRQEVLPDIQAAVRYDIIPELKRTMTDDIAPEVVRQINDDVIPELVEQISAEAMRTIYGRPFFSFPSPLIDITPVDPIAEPIVD